MIIDADAHWTADPEIFKSISAVFYENYLHDNEVFLSTIPRYQNSLKNDLKVDRQLLNCFGPTVGLIYQNIDRCALAEVYNRYMKNLCQEHCEFDYTSWIPLQDIAVCENLLDTDSVQQSFAIHMGEQVPWGFIPKYQNLFEKIAQSKLPVYLHFSGHDDFPPDWKNDINRRYLDFHEKYPTKFDAGVGESPTWKITLASLILSGLLEKHNLKIILAEQGLTWLEEFRDTMREISGIDPLPYFQEFFWFTVEPEESNFLQTSRTMGFDRLLFATDWPHGNGDIGGKNMLHDTDLVQSMLEKKLIDQNEFDALTFKNYLRIQNRDF